MLGTLKNVKRYLVANSKSKKIVSTINLENVKRIKILVGGDDIINVEQSLK